MKKLTHEETLTNGLVLRLETTASSMRVSALRDGNILAAVSQSHAGLHGPDSWRPEESRLAKSLKQQVEDRALGRVRRSAFDALVNEMRAAWNTRRVFGRAKPTLFVKDPRRKPPKQTAKPALFFGIGNKR